MYLKQKGYDPKTPFVSAFAAYQGFGSFANPHPHIHAIVKDALSISDKDNAQETHHQLDTDLLCQCTRETFLARLTRDGYLSTEDQSNMLTWENSGFNVHLTDIIEPKRIGAVIRYMLRAPYDSKRFRYDGERLVITPPKGSDRPTEILSATEAVYRIVSLIPAPRIHRSRAWGILAHKIRFLSSNKQQSTTGAQGRYRKPRYRDLLQRLVKVDPMCCDICNEELRRQVVDDDVAAHGSLDDLTMPTHRMICFNIDDWLQGCECPEPYVATSDDDELPTTDFDIVDETPIDDVPLILVGSGEDSPADQAPPKAKNAACKSLAARDPPSLHQCQSDTDRLALLRRLRKQTEEILTGIRNRLGTKEDGVGMSENTANTAKSLSKRQSRP